MVRWFAIIVFLQGVAACASPARPFPQSLDYGTDVVQPNRYTQAQLNAHIVDYYLQWKSDYLISAGRDDQGRALYRVAFGKDSKATVSEGQGYGMMIVALMAGHDPDAQMVFDGLWRYSRRYPSGIDGRLMSWKVDDGETVGGNTAAFDGDADIAYGLLLASAQWGNNGDIDYGEVANTVLAGLMESVVGPDSRLPMMGDWVKPDGETYNQFTLRTSDCMPGHFAAFARHSGSLAWHSVSAACESRLKHLQARSSAGLLPDFAKDCRTPESCIPAPDGYLEDETDGDYDYNAGRLPWRLAVDAILNGREDSRAMARRMQAFFAEATAGDPDRIAAGYTLDGEPIRNYFTTLFAAPVAVAAMLDREQQDFLNALYQRLYREHGGYYEDSVNLLSLLALSGNFWDPTQVPLPARKTASTTGLPALVLSLKRTSEWRDGYCSEATVYNPAEVAVDWEVEFTAPESIYKIWNARYTQSGETVTVQGVDWNKRLDSKASVSFGFCADEDAETVEAEEAGEPNEKET
ncbi:endo-1,4-beta-D-glucanase Y [Litorivivens lipolytica]|uniref:cellulase n=1 Tax=Litorivivens lipolytica TaxID=1524264 RepID=A0A7W4W414_9GAMM|nr:glycosyl hydrolase family 8 [Litorivivens lipolytica]MBB3046738.1 endo-1,4-beta-D-glucanase Y [Litorivivens lipolytica]